MVKHRNICNIQIEEEKGITLTALVITIILLLILAGVGISVGRDSIESAKLMSYGTELQAMQNKVNELEQELQHKKKSNDTDGANSIKNIGLNLQNTEQESKAFMGADESDTTGYKYYAKSVVEELGFKNFNSEFLVNVEKRKVIFLYGIEYRGKTIWTSEQLDGNEQYNVGYEGIDSIATFDLDTVGNKIYVNNISYIGNVKKGSVYYAQDINGTKEWKQAYSNITDKNCTIEVNIDGTFWIKIKDSAGNETEEKSIYVHDVIGKRASAILKIDKDATEPEKKSPYVQYDGNLYRVLYDTTSEYGIELISNSTVGDNVELGKNDPAGNGKTDAGELGSNERAIWSYTNAIETLNNAAESRVNTSDGVVSDVRCVGSRPGNKNFKVTDKYYKSLTPNTNSHFPDEYDGIWEQGEGVFGESEKPKWVIQNEVEDLAKINDLNITTIGEQYWIASRYVLAYLSTSTDFRVRYVNDTGSSNNYKALFYVQSSGNFIRSYGSLKVRPVLHLAPGVIITGGEGTESSPYTLGR